MTRFVSLAVFALMAVGVFGTDAAAQQFTWGSASVPNANPPRMMTYPKWDVFKGIDDVDKGRWDIGIGSAIFPSNANPPLPGQPPQPPRPWTVSEARVEVFIHNPLTGVWAAAPHETLIGTATGVAGTTNAFSITFSVENGVCSFRNFLQLSG